MKAISVQALIVGAVFLFSEAGCKKSEKAADASQPLAQSFQTADPETRKAMDTVSTHLKHNDYAAATQVLAPIVTQRDLTPPQKQAVSLALHQLNKAVAANPALDTKELFELRRKMYQAVDGGKRF